MNMITSDTYPATVMQIIPDTLKKFTSKTNKTVNSSILSVMSDASTQTTTGIEQVDSESYMQNKCFVYTYT